MSMLATYMCAVAREPGASCRRRRPGHFVRGHPLFVIELSMFVTIVIATLAAPLTATHSDIRCYYPHRW